MKKVILFTIFLGTLLSLIIYRFFYHETVQIVTLGDGLATGETYYDVTGYSFNDYLRDYLEETTKIDEYITEFANKKETSETLKIKLANNYTLESTDTKIQQALSKSSLITIALGTYELSHSKVTQKEMDNYLINMEKIINLLRVYNQKKIILLSLYPTSDLTKEDVSKINNYLQNLAQEKRIDFVDITSITENKDYFFNSSHPYPNYKGHRYLKNLIVKMCF
mgnify:FL=1